MRTSGLPTRIAHELAQDILLGELGPRDHLRARAIAERFGVSRTPVRDALTLLAQQGIVEQQPKRGYFVAPDARRRLDSGGLALAGGTPQDDYRRLADDWMRGALAEEVTLLALQERYGFSKARLQELLARASREGWAEQKPGYGWRLLPVARTPEAFDQICRFRMVIEPAAMLEPGFRVDRSAVAEQRRIQEAMIERDIDQASPERLVANGASFHEELIRMSGNPFFHMALVRVNRMRRLMECRAEFDRDWFVQQCTGHLQILDSLETGDLLGTSRMLRDHLALTLTKRAPAAGAGGATERSIRRE